MSATPLAIESPEVDFTAEIAHAAPFSGLPAPVLKAVAALAHERGFRADETLFAPGQLDSAEFFLVCAGRLRASYSDPHTGAMVIDEIGPGGFFRLAEIVAEDDSRLDAVTLAGAEDGRMLVFDAAAFRALAAQRPTITRNLMLFFAACLAGAGAADSQEFAPERRVFAALLEYVERDAVSGEWRIARMPKHRELAEKAGADEAVAAGAVARLIQDGVAHRDYPGLVIADIAKLSQLAG